MKNYFLLGIKENQDAYTKAKIKVCNQVLWMCLMIGFTYSFFIYAHYKPLVIYPVLLFAISATLLFMNKMGMFQIARFFASFQMLTLATMFQASIVQANEGFLVSFFCSQLAMTLIPWLLYGFKEKGMLALTSMICYGLLFSQQALNEVMEVNVDSTFFAQSYLNPMTYIFAMAISILLIILMKTDKSEVEAKVLQSV
ncbi:hypothetical protein [Aureibacter tunicatorum]|uniref:Uncharacterized protein n=1 Tax=Aureibacter tunicatorum TaxID=866807 RepID=A0AAE3XJU9_9BACT|nr:hypothetical protein [Aureibacter tunicatorum]MDR6237270.1 hypothetical protein [Aureibacter tunicatorum]BDD06262.1 hypothetical protein AUTU_37450 [Aureibacter tunicatorum]